MLILAACILGLAAFAGVGLVALYDRTRPTRKWQNAAFAHGVVGVLGLIILIIALSGPPRGVAMGAGGFGRAAAVLVALAAALAGLAVWIRRRGSGAAPLVIGLHATLAVAGLALLLTYLSYPA